MTEQYIAQGSDEIEGRVTQKLPQEFCGTGQVFWVLCPNLVQISSEPASTDMLRNRSGNIMEQ